MRLGFSDAILSNEIEETSVKMPLSSSSKDSFPAPMAGDLTYEPLILSMAENPRAD